MNQRVKVLFDEASKLDPAEREELLELLMASIEPDPEIEAAWLAEVEDRIAAHERGEATARPAADVLAKYIK